MPRHHKAADKQRSERVEIRLTIDEAHELVTRAITARMSTSDYIRRSALGTDGVTLDRAALIVQLDELTKIGTALGQLVRSGKYASSAEQTELLMQAVLNIKTLSAHLIQKLS